MRKTQNINEILARNLKFFMARPSSLYRTANSLAGDGISANTVRNLLDPKKRTTTLDKPVGYPTLDKLAALAGKLGCEAWELLHPDIEQSLRERAMYKNIQANFHKAQTEAVK